MCLAVVGIRQFKAIESEGASNKYHVSHTGNQSSLECERRSPDPADKEARHP